MKRIIWSTVAGTIALVGWGMFFWGLLAPRLGVFHRLPAPEAVTQALTASETATGTYFMPWPRNTPETYAAFLQQHKQGPFYQLSYVREGADPEAPGKLFLGVLQYALTAVIAAALLALTRPSSWGKAFTTILLAGWMGTVFNVFSGPIWFGLPWDYPAGLVVYEAVAWLLLAASNATLRPNLV